MNRDICNAQGEKNKIKEHEYGKILGDDYKRKQ